MTEIIDSMKKDLTSTKDDKAAQLLEYEETLEDLPPLPLPWLPKDTQTKAKKAKTSPRLSESTRILSPTTNLPTNIYASLWARTDWCE